MQSKNIFKRYADFQNIISIKCPRDGGTTNKREHLVSKDVNQLNLQVVFLHSRLSSNQISINHLTQLVILTALRHHHQPGVANRDDDRYIPFTLLHVFAEKLNIIA